MTKADGWRIFLYGTAAGSQVLMMLYYIGRDGSLLRVFCNLALGAVFGAFAWSKIELISLKMKDGTSE